MTSLRFTFEPISGKHPRWDKKDCPENPNRAPVSCPSSCSCPLEPPRMNVSFLSGKTYYGVSRVILVPPPQCFRCPVSRDFLFLNHLTLDPPIFPGIPFWMPPGITEQSGTGSLLALVSQPPAELCSLMSGIHPVSPCLPPSKALLSASWASHF